ncbi:mandelate racemase/muconate lactonizing enzyme family protein [Auraticoccus monumenti]|uniref:L-alanine-DL-glutamate epimerase n=1 Tax=Auraticoccus monumenti TaxID=675864 RepID=A0A1G7EYU8_9ACTN|nr:enolase C-terminal domain-like protein [Auraticoccus monumenti]SDE68829.1 L-alanine-DL-glutamate epimerase [Auraticoccus monumenti]
MSGASTAVGSLLLRGLSWWSLHHPLRRSLTHASVTTDILEALIVRADFDDVAGWAEVRTNGRYATGEDTGTVLTALTRTPLLDRTVEQGTTDLLPCSRLAAMALDVAAHDAAARAGGRALHLLLGGPPTSRLATHAQVPFGTVGEAGLRAREAVTDGFGRIKVRVGGPDVDHDIARVAAVRAAAGDGVELLTDANAGWDLAQAVQASGRLAPLGVRWLEQPVRGVADLARVSASSDVPVRADESVRDADDVAVLAAADAVQGVHLKLEKTGTVARLRTAVAVARSAGLHVALGQMDQGRLGCAATTSLAAGLGIEEAELWGCADVDPTDDVAGPLILLEGSVLVPQGPGLGVVVTLTTPPSGALPR